MSEGLTVSPTDKSYDYRIKLRDKVDSSRLVIFDATPDVVETRNVNYKTIDPVHAPGQIYAYVNSASRTFQISSVKLISRNQNEATINLVKLWTLRSWTMPYFGRVDLNNTQEANNALLNDDIRVIKDFYGDDPALAQEAIRERTASYRATGGLSGMRGAPPSVLYFSAYSIETTAPQVGQHINRVPVVITNLNIPFPADTDYIPTTTGVPMPTIMTIDISLAETHSPSEYERFNLDHYRNGTLPGF